MPLDEILDNDQYPVFEGTPDEVQEWAREHPQTISSYMVRLGNSVDHMSISDYLKSIE